MGLLIAAPLFSHYIIGLKNRFSRKENAAKGWMFMTKVVELASLTFHNIGCGLVGGFLALAKGHSASASQSVAARSSFGQPGGPARHTAA